MRIICMVGPIGAGKTTFARWLAEDMKGRVLSTSSLLEGNSRREKQDYGDRQDNETDGGWVADAIVPVIKAGGNEKAVVVVDCVRRRNQIRETRKRWKTDVIVIGIRTSNIEDHIKTRDIESMREIAAAMQHPVEKALPMEEADIIINNTRMLSSDSVRMLRP